MTYLLLLLAIIVGLAAAAAGHVSGWTLVALFVAFVAGRAVERISRLESAETRPPANWVSR